MTPRLAIVSLLATLVLSGCSEDPEPRIAAEPTTSPSSVAPTTTTSPTTSPIGKSESAAEFVQRWLDVSADMQRSGDTTGYLAITMDCQPCDELADRVDSYYRAGGYITFQGQQVLSTERIRATKGITVLRTLVDAEPTEYKSSSSAPTERIEGGTESLEIVLTGSASEGWSVNNYLRVAQ